MVKPAVRRKFILWFGLIFYLGFLWVYINMSYPMVGHDYRYFLSRMIDTYLHYRSNGLSIQWFSPSFGGGLPAYFNPQHIQFSIPQLFLFILDPWKANFVAITIFVSAGYWSSYYLGTEVMQLNWRAASLGALFFITNGFYIQRVTVGHMGFQTFPLIPLIFYLLFSTRWSPISRAIWIGLVITLILHEAGFYLLVIFVFIALIFIPLMYLISPTKINSKQVFFVGLLGLLIGLLLSLGKIYAVFTYLQSFPRELINFYYSTWGDAVIGLITQFIGIPFFTIPFRIIVDEPSAIAQVIISLAGGGSYGVWEVDASVSPVLIMILFSQIFQFILKKNFTWRQKFRDLINSGKVIPLGIFIFGIYATFEFVSARGFIFQFLNSLPILSSLHNIRFASSYLFPLSILGAYFFQREFERFNPEKRNFLFLLSFSFVILFVGVYLALPSKVQERIININLINKEYQNVRLEGEWYVEEVKDIPDMIVFSKHASSLYPYEPIFGYKLEEFDTQLVPGSIYLESDGYYNMTNPRSLVYDSDQLFERFSLDQREMMEQFSHYQQPDWKIPKTQLALNWVSGITAVVILIYGCILGVKWFLRRKNIAAEF